MEEGEQGVTRQSSLRVRQGAREAESGLCMLVREFNRGSFCWGVVTHDVTKEGARPGVSYSAVARSS